jgi:hypothetical protein
MGARLVVALAGLALSAPGASAPVRTATRLFADDQPIHVSLVGPISAIARTPASSRAARPAILKLISPAAEQHAVLLSPRGIARRTRTVCTFPPLRVEFTARPPAASLFERQHRLKLTTYCRMSPGHQQHVLLEYAAYRLYNVMSPASLRVRLATVDYAEPDGGGAVSRLGFFAEDPGDAAKRNGLVEVKILARIAPSQLDPAAEARSAMFEYMIGNLDWSMRAAHAGESCCHNFKLMGTAANARTTLVPVPYDFDYSGFVNAPYALPPEGLNVSSVRDRRYRGYCIHNGQAIAVAAEFRAKRGELAAVLPAIAGLTEDRRRKASAYLDEFFSDIATDASVTSRLLKTCIN